MQERHAATLRYSLHTASNEHNTPSPSFASPSSSSQGLGLRWSFMGPFETIDLNAPNGVNDYCNRYLPGIERGKLPLSFPFQYA
jgi:hypothetical protein